MTGLKIALCVGSEEQKTQVRSILLENSYIFNELEAKGPALIRTLIAAPPELLLCDFELETQKTLKIIIEDDICPVIMIVDDPEREIIETSSPHGDKLYLIQKSINRNAFLNNLEFIIKNITRINELKKEIIDLQTVLENRKIMDRAKALLMKKYCLDEEKAHRYIQKKSMETRKPVREIADIILRNK